MPRLTSGLLGAGFIGDFVHAGHVLYCLYLKMFRLLLAQKAACFLCEVVVLSAG